MPRTLFALAFAAALAVVPPMFAANPSKGADMDYGSFQCYTIGPKGSSNDIVLKGIAIHLGTTNEPAAVCFDTELLRYAAGWTGDFLDISKTHLTSYKGSLHALIAGTIRFSSGLRAGWNCTGSFDDPRPFHAGPLPRNWGRYRGLYRFGDKVVLHYQIGNSEAFEVPEYESNDGIGRFSRTIQISPLAAPRELLICELPAGASHGSIHRSLKGRVMGVIGDACTLAGLTGGENYDVAIRLQVVDNERLQVSVPALSKPVTFKVSLWTGSQEDAKKAERVLTEDRVEVRPADWCKGGPPLWPQIITTPGRLGFGNGAYVVDTITVPEKNPWNAWMRLIALDFFADGRAAVSTWNGDVWIVSGIDDKLRQVRWKRFAAGLFEGLGLKIVNDEIYVIERSQITRLRDLNHDGEADAYDNFNNDAPIGPSYHAFAFGLDTDNAGNFYYTRCGHRVDPRLPLNGGMIQVSPDGRTARMFATGMRAPNGMSIGPDDRITCSDNQGNWTPASRVNLVEEGGFYGYVPHARRSEMPTDYDKPICWLPMNIDNSSGGQIWVTSDRWGPLKGQLLHTSYGKGTLMLLPMETVDGQVQGGAVQFPLRFESGIMRGRFNPVDGQLYVCGLKGWQTAGARDAALQRVRYTGKPLVMPDELHVTGKGIHIHFTGELDAASAGDEQNYAAEQWNYRWTAEYGSPDYSVADPDEKGHDPVVIRAVKVSADRRSVFLDMPSIRPVMQMKIQFRVKAATGSSVSYEIYNTIHNLGPEEEISANLN